MHPLTSGDAMFFVGLSEKVYNRETNQHEWTNYDTALFAKQGQQLQFYQQALVAGSVVSVTGKTAKVEVYQKNDGTQGAKIVLNDCSLDFVHTDGQAQSQQVPQQQMQPQQQAQPQMQQAPQQQQWGQQPQQQAPF